MGQLESKGGTGAVERALVSCTRAISTTPLSAVASSPSHLSNLLACSLEVLWERHAHAELPSSKLHAGDVSVCGERFVSTP